MRLNFSLSSWLKCQILRKYNVRVALCLRQVGAPFPHLADFNRQLVGNKTEVGTYVKLSINNVSFEREGELLNGCSIYLYCLKGFSVSSISNSPGAMNCCNLYIFLFISRNHLTQRVSTLFPGPLVSSIRPSIRQN